MAAALALLLALAAPPEAIAPPAAAERHRLKPTVGWSTFAARPPVLTVRPGDRLESETLWGEWYEKDGGAWPGEVGPIAVEGAKPGDTLVVKILRVRPNRDVAISTHRPGFSALGSDLYTPMLGGSIPARRFIWRLDPERGVGVLDLPASRIGRVELPLRPMLGRVATAPPGEQSWGGLWPGEFGGNLDFPELGEGITVYLPVFHPGALFYFGDGHALQGDGEVCGSGLETTMDVAFEFGLQPGRKIAWPRLEDRDSIMVAGSVRPLTDALRIASVEMIEWLVADYGYDRWEALQVFSQAASLRIANAVDPNYTVVAKFPKRLLPPAP